MRPGLFCDAAGIGSQNGQNAKKMVLLVCIRFRTANFEHSILILDPPLLSCGMIPEGILLSVKQIVLLKQDGRPGEEQPSRHDLQNLSDQ